MKKRGYGDTINLITGPQSVPKHQRSEKGNRGTCLTDILLDVDERDLDWEMCVLRMQQLSLIGTSPLISVLSCT